MALCNLSHNIAISTAVTTHHTFTHRGFYCQIDKPGHSETFSFSATFEDLQYNPVEISSGFRSLDDAIQFALKWAEEGMFSKHRGLFARMHSETSYGCQLDVLDHALGGRFETIYFFEETLQEAQDKAREYFHDLAEKRLHTLAGY